MVFFVGLIMFNVINNAREKTYFKYYQQPYSFESKNFTAHSGVIHGGGTAHFAAMWTAMTVTVFSMIGFEAVSITAPENKDLATEENIKLATRKISLRIILLYTLGAFVVGLNVPYDDPQLRDADVNAINNGAHSAFIVAAVRDGVLGFPSLFNAIFIFSATSAGLNALIKRAAQGFEPGGQNIEQDQAAYNRENKSSYPYKSHWQYVRAWFGLLACSFVALFNGWQTFHPFSGGDFIAAYITYHVKVDRTWNPLKWSRSASEDLNNPVKAVRRDPSRRRGKLSRSQRDRVISQQNLLSFWEWVWTERSKPRPSDLEPMSHTSISSLWRRLEERRDVAMIIREAIGQHAIEVAANGEDRFAPKSLQAFNRLVNLIIVAFQIQRAYLQSNSPSHKAFQYLVQPLEVFDVLSYLLTVRNSYKGAMNQSHPILDHILRALGNATLSSLRLLTLLKTKIRSTKDVLWTARAETIRCSIKDWPLQGDSLHRFLIQELCLSLLEYLSTSAEDQALENFNHGCRYHEETSKPRRSVDLPEYFDGLVNICHEGLL
ncbi:MAG: hypothetical protein Q9191_002250 [Dirinaria sp. TL-2023a]